MSSKVYVGNLGTHPDRETEAELERAFQRYGRLSSVWVARRPAGFAFIEFEDPRDAEEAVREMDGRRCCGRSVKVELSTKRPGGRDRGDRGDRGGRYSDRDSRSRRRSRSRSPRRSRSPSYDRYDRKSRSVSPVREFQEKKY